MPLPGTPTSPPGARPSTSSAMDISHPNPTVSPADRRATHLSTVSSTMSFGSIPSGTWDVSFHGSCPKCHHWHNKMTLRLSRLPGVYNGVRCEKCSYKWFGLGGNSTHTSLVSQQTRTLTFVSDLSGYASTAPSGDAATGTSALVTRLHSMGALASPFITNCSVPQRPEDDQERQGQEQTRPPSRLRAYMSPSLGRDANALSQHSSRSSQARTDQPYQSDHVSRPIQADSCAEHGRPKPRGLRTKIKGKLRAILNRLRQAKAIRRARRQASCHSVDTSRATTTENSRPLPVNTKPSQAAQNQAVPDQREQVPMLPRGPDEVAPVLPLSRRQSAPEPSSQVHNLGSDSHGDDVYQKPFSLEPRPRVPRNDARIQEIRRAKTMLAQQTRCECPASCSCKRPTSSLIPDYTFTDSASLAGLDLAQSSGSRISRHSADFAGIGSHFMSHHPNISEGGLTMSSAGSIRGRSQTRRGRDVSWRRSNGTTWGSQTTTVYADSDAGSSTATGFSYPRSDLLNIAPPIPWRTRIPSPLASPTNLTGFLDGDGHRTPQRTESESSADEDHPVSERAPGGVPSVSPIQEAVGGGSGRVSTISMNSGYNYGDVSPRVSVDTPAVGARRRPSLSSRQSSSSELHGPLDSHPVM